MSGLNEIIQWVDENYEFEEGEDPQQVFEQLDKDENWRAPLADILNEQLPKFILYLEEKTHTSREEVAFNALIQRADSVEQQIRELLKGFTL